MAKKKDKYFSIMTTHLQPELLNYMNYGPNSVVISPHLPDVVLSDFFFFPKLKTYLARKKFLSNEKVTTAAEGSFVDFKE